MTWKDIPGYSGFLWLYDEFIDRCEPERDYVVVEVGVALGHSVAYLARRAIDAKVNLKIYAVDPWGGYARNGEQQELGDQEPGGDFGLFCRMMVEHEPEALRLIHPLRMTSVAAANMIDEPEPIDLVLIDGAHDFDSVRRDIAAWCGHVALGDGIIAGDDCEPNYPDVEKAVREAFGDDFEVHGTTWVHR